MSGQTKKERIEKIKTRLTLYYKAEEEILDCGKSYSISDRSLTRADLEQVRSEIKRLENLCDILESGGGVSIKFGVPRN